MSNKNSISYRQVGNYLIPNRILPHEEANIRLGKWGMLHKTYLEKHKTAFFSTLLIQGKLYQHCFEVETQAQNMFDTLIEQMKAAGSVTEQLKAKISLNGCAVWGILRLGRERLFVRSLSATKKKRCSLFLRASPIIFEKIIKCIAICYTIGYNITERWNEYGN